MTAFEAHEIDLLVATTVIEALMYSYRQYYGD